MSVSPIQILLQTTIPTTTDNWSINRFSLLAQLLRDHRGAGGKPTFNVLTRDRDSLGSSDSVLSIIDKSTFDELWLFAVDDGDGLSEEDCAAITRFRRAGRGLMIARDHMDLGSSICRLGGVGEAHHFHSHNLDPDVLNRVIDDPFTKTISWPNFHSGANGDFQQIEIHGDIHPVLKDPDSPTGAIRFLPSHPHEGAVSAPPGSHARVIATGISKVSGKRFNLAVAFEKNTQGGPAIAQSTFHHFADYNWDTRRGCPSFVEEPAGDAIMRDSKAMADTHRYVLNVAFWLGAQKAGSLV